MSNARELSDLVSAAPSTDANFDGGTLYIDRTNNRVGIGTSSPATALDVNGNIVIADSGTIGSASATSAITIDSAGNVGIGVTSISTQGQFYIGASGTSTDAKIGLSATNSGGGQNPLAQIGSSADGTYGSTLYFNTRSTDGTIAERMRITSSGRVGIGEPTPWSLLDVRGTAGNANLNTLTLQNDDYGANETGQAITQLFRLNRAGTMRDAASIKVGKDSDWDDAANADSHLTFSTTLNDTLTERMRIDSSGYVGIGTSSPVYPVSVGDGSDATQYVDIKTTNTGSGGLLFSDADANARGRVEYIHSDDSMRLRTSGIERMRIDSSGNVGIGGTPSYKLDVKGDNAGGSVTLRVFNQTTNVSGSKTQILMPVYNGTSGFSITSYSSTTDGYDAFLTTGQGGSDLIFGSGAGTERMRIDSSGNVGIGTSSPSKRLTVATGTTTDGAFNPAIEVGLSGTSQGGVIGSRTAAGNQRQGLYVSSSQMLTLWGDGAGDGSGVLDVVSGSSPSATTAADSLFHIDSDGNVGIGTASPACSLQVNGSIRARGGAPGSNGVNNNGFAFSGNSGDVDGGMYSSADGQIEFYANNSEKMRIDSSGNVMVGVTSAPTGAFNSIVPTNIVGPYIVNTILKTPTPNAGTFTISLTGSSITAYLDVVVWGSFNTTNREGYAAYRVLCNRTTTSVTTITVQAPTNTGGTFTSSYSFTASKPDTSTLTLVIGKPSGANYNVGINGQFPGSGISGISTSFA